MEGFSPYFYHWVKPWNEKISCYGKNIKCDSFCISVWWFYLCMQQKKKKGIMLLCCHVSVSESVQHIVGTQWAVDNRMNQYYRARPSCQLLNIFDLVSLVLQEKSPALFLPLVGQLGLFTPVVSQIPKQCGIAWNYTSGLCGVFLLPTLLAVTLLQLLVCQLLW